MVGYLKLLKSKYCYNHLLIVHLFILVRINNEQRIHAAFEIVPEDFLFKSLEYQTLWSVIS